MKRVLGILFTSLFLTISLSSQNIDSLKLSINKIEHSLIYKKGIISLDSGNAVLTVPDSYKFLSRSQSIFVLTKIYGNPLDSSVIGMLIPNDKGILDQDGWVFTISYKDIGYINEINVNEINYEVLLNDLNKEIIEVNKSRLHQGFSSVQLIGWASQPLFDKNRKILQWATEVNFGKDSLNTLNYSIRILGKKGVYILNAVASMKQLPAVKSTINDVIGSIQFIDGYKYSEFKQGIDKISDWTLIDLIRAKSFKKERTSPGLLNYWKIIALSIAALTGTYLLIMISRKKKKSPSEKSRKG